LPECHSRDIERHRSLWLLWCVIGKTEGSGHDVFTGEDVPFAHQEASANHTAIQCVDPYE
jgi:hypothetical protein